MPASPADDDTRIRALSPHLKGHLFDFGARPTPPLPAATAVRLLLIFVLLEYIIGPHLEFLRWFHWPAPAIQLRLPFLIALALLLLRGVDGLRLRDLGLRGWRDWGPTEHSYSAKAILLGTIVFCILFARPLERIGADRSLWPTAALVIATQLAWGFYQELVYRGLLQTALVSRWGSVAGIVVANLLFTFGPLHFYHFANRAPALAFAGAFATGLFFSLLFRWSGNLWLVGLLHGLGITYMNGVRWVGR